MISKGDYMEIKAQHERGVYKKDIASKLGVHPRTVTRALVRGGPPCGKRPRARGSKLDPFKEFIDSELAAGVWNAEVILQKLRRMGYEGGRTILRDYIRPKRPLRDSRRTVACETGPGKQAQCDWAEQPVLIAGVTQVVHFLVTALGYSRRFFFWITDKEDANHTYEGQQLAFQYFGGVTETTLLDNQKACVVSHRMGEKVVFNPAYLDFCHHYGTRPLACRPGRARTKGKVERIISYIKDNFFAHYPKAESFAHYNQLALEWLSEVADSRVHGTCGEVVRERFEKERGHLLALPPALFDTSYREERTVWWDAYIDVCGNRYAVGGHLTGKRVEVRIGLDGIIRVFDAQELVAVHTRRDPAAGWASCPAYHARLWQEASPVEARPLSVYEEVLT